MSAEPRYGRIETVILDAMGADPCATFDARELAALAFPGVLPAKKHFVSVLRAARRLAQTHYGIEELRSRSFPWCVVYVNPENPRSFSLGKLRVHFNGAKSVAEC